MKFTEKEKNYLISATENRIKILRKEINNEIELISNKHYIIAKSIIDKINFNETISGKQKSMLTGIVRENYYYDVEERKEFYYKKKDVEILNLTKDEEIEIEYISEIETLLNKLLLKSERINSLSNYLKPYKVLSKLPFKKSFFSISGEKIYKIGFPIDKEKIIHIELDHNYSLFPFSITEIQNWKRLYTHIENNDTILELIKKYEKDNKLSNRMIFAKETLKKAIS